MISRFITVELLLRIGVSFAFIYPAVSAWFNPYAWVGYFPSLMHVVIGQNDLLFLHMFGILELVIAFWILSGKHILLPILAASLLLFLIIAFNLNQFDVLFRDVPILLMTLALLLSQTKLKRSDRVS